MSVIAAELLKLKRASVWVVALVVPLMSIITGTVNTVMNPGVLGQDWGSLWGQITLFYGLLFLSLGIAIMASAVWRPEHRGNWPRLMAGATRSWQLVVAKLVALTALVCAMQVVLVAGSWLCGVLAVGLPVALPLTVPAVAALTVVASVAVAALHSLLSMVIRSFAAPVALALLGCVAAIGLTLAEARELSMALPYGTLLRAVNIGGSAVSDAGELSWASAGAVAAPALALAAVCVAVQVAVLERRDVRA